MAWTAPRTWVAGEIVTAAVMNTHVRDNLNAILSAADTLNSAINTWAPSTNMTLAPTTGDIKVGAHVVPSTGNTFDLGNSTSGYRIIYHNPPRVSLQLTSGFGYASGVDTAVPFATEYYDTDSMHSTSANTPRITINTAGVYLVSASIDTHPSTANATNYQALIGIDGAFSSTAGLIRSERYIASPFNDFTQQISGILNLTSTQYIELLVRQDSGSTDPQINPTNTNLSAIRLGD